jgi:hypothetical protein
MNTGPAEEESKERRRWLRSPWWQLVEVALLIPAFGLLIPPIPSDAATRPQLGPGMYFGLALFGGSATVGCWRGAQHWAVALLKGVLFAVLAWLIIERVRLG